MPSEEEIESVFVRMDHLYQKIELPHYLHVYSKESATLVLKDIIRSVKRDASPGVPYSMSFKTNGEMIDRMGNHLINIVLDRIERIINWNGVIHDRASLVDQDLMDPIRVFIKNEPHSFDKCNQSRFRLIMSVSIVDKLIEMFLNIHFNKNQIANWDKIPSKPGMGFVPQMAQTIYNQCDLYGLDKLASADVSGWDWSVKDWLLNLETRYRLRLHNGTSGFYRDLMYKKSTLEANSIYQFSDGVLVQPKFSGIQNSGKYNTSSGNSMMRVLVAFLVGADWAIAMGDDCIESFVVDAKQKYEDLGFRVKMYDKLCLSGTFEFCSHIFGNGVCYSVTGAKGLMRLLHNDSLPLVDRKLLTMQFEDDYCQSPEYKRLMQDLIRVGWYSKI